jgi:hypothetical protein
MVLNESQARVSAEGHNSWRQYKKDWILGTNAGKLFAFGMVFLVLLSGGSLAWMSIDHGEELGADWDFWQSLWWSWSLLFDPGTHTGLPADAPFITHAVALTCSVAGFFFFLVVLGIVVDLVRSALDYSNEVCSRVVENNHTLILGWGNRAIYLLQELLAAYREDRNKVTGCCGRRRSKRIVILAEKPQFEVLQEINMHFLKDDDSDSHFRRSLIQYREGDPTDWKELEKVSASSADDILVLRTNGTPQASDNHAMQCCLALSALSSDQAVTGEVFAEVQNPKILGMVTACNASGVVLRRTAIRMLCHQCLHPAVGEALQEIISFTTNHVYLVAKMPDELRGKTLMQASMYYPNAMLIGTRTSTERLSERSLVFISQGEPKFRKPRRNPDGSRLSRNSTWSTSTLSSVRIRRIEAQKRAEAAAGEGDAPIVRSPSHGSDVSAIRSCISEPLSPTAEPISPSARSAHSYHSGNTLSPRLPPMERPRSPQARWHRDVVQQTGRNVVVMIGSPSDISIHVWSLQNLTRKPLDLHILTSHTPAFTGKVPVDPAKGSVTWYVGDSTDEQDLQKLPLKQAASILVMAFKLDQDEPAAPTDARSLSTVFQLREILKHRGSHEAPGDEEEPKIVCELMDIRSKLVVETGAFRGTASFFHSVRVETALFATAADDTQVFNMLMLLVEPNGMDLCVATADQMGIFDERPMAGTSSTASSLMKPTDSIGASPRAASIEASPRASTGASARAVTWASECSGTDYLMDDSGRCETRSRAGTQSLSSSGGRETRTRMSLQTNSPESGK